MRTASMVLGIIGGVLAVLLILVFVFIGVFFNNVKEYTSDIPFNNIEMDIKDIDGDNLYMDIEGADIMLNNPMDSVFGIFNVIMWVGGILSLLGGAFGIIGGVFAKRKNVMAGVFMLVGSVLCLLTIYGILSFILLLLGGIFALVKDNSQQQPQLPAAQ